MNGKAEQLGVFGGTFNPVHHGHLILAREAMEYLKLDQLLLVPNSRSPLREGEKLARPEDRLEMLRLAVGDEPGMKVCDLEVRRGGASYTVETLEELRAVNPESQLTFLCGADSLNTLDRWVRIERIAELARICVLTRPGTEADSAYDGLIRRAPHVGRRVHLLTMSRMIDLSATEIRTRLAAGRPVRWMIPDSVERYIREHKLFT